MTKSELGLGVILFTLLIGLIIAITYQMSDKLQENDNIEELLSLRLGETSELLNHTIFDDFVVAIYKEEDKINRKIYKIDHNDLIYVSAYQDIRNSYYGTIQIYDEKIFLIVTGIAKKGQSIEVYYNGLEDMKHKLFSRTYEIQDDYFIIIDQLHSESGFEFLVDPKTKISDD